MPVSDARGGAVPDRLLSLHRAAAERTAQLPWGRFLLAFVAFLVVFGIGIGLYVNERLTRQRILSVGAVSAPDHVTAVGGTLLSVDDSGHRTKPDVVWNDKAGAGGGGLSSVFPRPAYQASVAATEDKHRTVPDISMAAASGSSMISRFTDNTGGGWLAQSGTSLAAPLFAGLVALAAQDKGAGLGNINGRLYELAPDGSKSGILDVTSGTNGKGGYAAGPGYDLASGLGTVDAAALVPQLAAG